MEAINFTAYTNNSSQVDAIKAFMKALKIKFEVAEESPYNPEFVTMIEESRKQAKEGKVTRVNNEDLKDFLGV